MTRYQRKQFFAYTGLIIFSVLLVVSLFFIKTKTISDQAQATPTATVEPTATVTPTESATLEPTTNLPITQQKAKLQFMGDITLGNNILASAKRMDGTYNFTDFFAVIKPYITGDAAFANLEGAIEAGNSYTGSPIYNYPSAIVNALKETGISNIITANDHAFDKLYNGVTATKEQLLNAGLNPIGTYTSQKDRDTAQILEINGIKIGVVAYTDSTNNMEENISPIHLSYALRFIDWDDISKTQANISSDIAQLRQAGADLVITSFHWGTKFEEEPSSAQRNLAQYTLEAGADIIMGTGSHVAQPVTVKTITIDGQEKKVVVMYSLGNFFADQVADNNYKTQAGFICNIDISRNEETQQVEIGEVTYIPTYINRWTQVNTTDNSTVFNYRVLPSAPYSEAAECPKTFADENAWNLCKNAYKHIKEVLNKLKLYTEDN